MKPMAGIASNVLALRQGTLVYLLLPSLLKLPWISMEKEETDGFLAAAARGGLRAAPAA